MPTIRDNINSVRERVQQAARDTGRNPREILLLAVSKTKPASAICDAIDAGVRDFGENYLQEALEKIAQLQELSPVWHFIGPIQSNKTRAIAEHFEWVHSVDRLKIAQRLSRQRPDHLPPLNLCLQINIDEEPTKSGFTAGEIPGVIKEVLELENIRLRGLMAIPQPRADQNEQRQPFRKLRELMEHCNSGLDNSVKLDTLSMGMSADLEAAVAEGATIVRIGSDIFGARN